MLRTWGAQMNLVAYMCKDKSKTESLSLINTQNHHPRSVQHFEFV